MTEYGPEFDPMDFRTSPLYRDLKALVEEHTDPNAPAFIVTPTSGNPDDVKAAVIAGTIANSPAFVAEYQRRRTNRLLYGFDVWP
jgi:hypothetical protein